MVIKSISLTNFRNYQKREFEFSPKINLVVGPNTSGKTNLLEAIFLLSSGSSPRAGLYREMIKEGAEFAFVSGGVGSGPVGESRPRNPAGETHDPSVGVKEAGGELAGTTSSDGGTAGEKELEVQLIASKNSPTLTTKRFKINGVAKRLSDFLSEFHVVLFSPEDLNLVIGSPDLRRKFLDFALANVDPRYRRASTEYDKVRRRRNRLLEAINQGQRSEGELAFWDAKLLEFGVFLQDGRRKFFDEINPILHTSLFMLQYLISGLTAERLRELRPREIAAETTLIGPHRDDFRFAKTQIHTDLKANSPSFAEASEGRRGSDLAKFGSRSELRKSRDLSAYGSRSEQRRSVLALKKAELEFVEGKLEERPVLLLDDIFSELDEENRAKVSSFIDEGQTIITTADINHIPGVVRENSKTTKL